MALPRDPATSCSRVHDGFAYVTLGEPPVVVEMRDGTASITLHLMMQFGARIPSVAEKVQENVKSAVQNMTNVTVSRVDLVIAGLTEAQ